MRCLFIYPKFTAPSFWNYRAACDLLGAKYPAAPLGLITVAAMLPESWEVRLIDMNVEPLSEEAIQEADLILIGGMIAQQSEHLSLIDHFHTLGKTVIVGGPDATNSPHLYDKADHLILGEAEVTFKGFLKDFCSGRAQHIYSAKNEKADLSTSPVPRFDLLKLSSYLHVGIQIGRGCPFKCEFCDIIELFGRVPRLKPPSQVLHELDVLYSLGYRGHVDIVDDNFIGNRESAKKFLVELHSWLKTHNWPFEFSTEASLNLAKDPELLRLMQEVGFCAVFVGVESPDEHTLRAMQKQQNTIAPIPESTHEILRHGMVVNAGYIVGFDTESGSIAENVLELIEATSIPVNMVGLLYALPSTQLSKRLQKEGRLHEHFDIAPTEVACQSVAGLNFETRRPRSAILSDYKKIVEQSYAAAKYFGRIRRSLRIMNCSKKRLRLPISKQLRDLQGFSRLLIKMGIESRYRNEFWKTLFCCLFFNPRSLRYVVAMCALYLHFDPFKEYVLSFISRDIEREEGGLDSYRTLRATSQFLQRGFEGVVSTEI
ncbi:MAG: B12-binding domain-containing radical SAM protein [Deltaproteobacteria bacterium]|nr:B12-binding domain-containing radical SAM protein [Deltaproteobacteria bacterium]